MELWPEPVLIRPAHLVPARATQEDLGKTLCHSFHSFLLLLTRRLDTPKGWPAREVSAGSHWPPRPRHVIPGRNASSPPPSIVWSIASHRISISSSHFTLSTPCLSSIKCTFCGVYGVVETHFPLIWPVCGYRRSAPITSVSGATTSRHHSSLQRQ